MSPLLDDHALEGCGGCLRVVEGRHRNPTHGRQGKRPAFSAAYVVGKNEEFTDVLDTPCWRFPQIVKRFQSFERRRLTLLRGLAP